MLEAVSEFFSFIIAPITMFFQQIAFTFIAAGTYILEFFISFWQGIMDFLQSITNTIGGG